MFTKNDIKTGMFGTMSDGQNFVVVNDILVCKEGGYDYLDSLDNDLSFPNSKTFISRLYTGARSFRMMADEKNHKYLGVVCVYDRHEEEKKITRMTIAEIEKALNINNLKIVERK